MSSETDIKCSLDHPHCPKPADEHDHPHARERGGRDEHKPLEKRRLLLALGITSVMMIAEFVGGLLTGSLALISDAGHMLTHSFALGISFCAISIACLPTNKERSFGLYRVEVLAALLNGITLLVISFFIFWEGIHRIITPVRIATREMLIVAVIGLVVNLVTAAMLSGVGKHDINVRSAFLHMLGDTLSSVAIVAGGVFILLTDIYVVDPILSLLIGTVILLWSVKLIRESLHVLLETTPRHIRIEDVIATIRAACPGIRHVHDIHIWEITSRMYAMTAHVVIDDVNVSAAQAITCDVCRVLDEKHDIEHATIQLEVANHAAEGRQQAVSSSQ